MDNSTDQFDMPSNDSGHKHSLSWIMILLLYEWKEGFKFRTSSLTNELIDKTIRISNIKQLKKAWKEKSKRLQAQINDHNATVLNL